MDTKPKKKLYKRWWFWVLAVIALLIIAGQLFELIYVKGASMEPTLEDHNVVIGSKLFFLNRGDIVQAEYRYQNYYYIGIKRIIGLPNDKVDINDGRILVNGQVINEPYTQGETVVSSSNNSWALGQNQYFVLGDNRLNSLDSRMFGTVSRSDIKYKILFK